MVITVAAAAAAAIVTAAAAILIVYHNVYHVFHVVHFPGKQKQMRSYVNCIKNYGKPLNHTYAAFLDIDELLVLKTTWQFGGFLSRISSCDDDK